MTRYEAECSRETMRLMLRYLRLAGLHVPDGFAELARQQGLPLDDRGDLKVAD